jgi:RimJ/RimL family protein N-acetyltransferase
MGVLEIPILDTERLRLRAFRKSDLDSYLALHTDPEVMRYLVGVGPVPWDKGRCWRHIAFQLGHWQLEGSGVWALEHRETGGFIGMVGFAEPEEWPGCELSWKLVRRWWGHGYATEGARAALAYAFDVLGKDHIISLINPENHASTRVAERLGERLEGRTEFCGREMLRYGIDRESYAARAGAGRAHLMARVPNRCELPREAWRQSPGEL